VRGAHEIAWQCASVLLGYPDEQQRADLDVVRRAAGELPTDLGLPLRALADHLAGRPLEELQADYVATFDNRRRTNLFLTYFAHGDTRKRGVALLRFKQTYLRSGVVLDDTELPDHLCVVLEYAATVEPELGRRLLLDHRAGLELLRLGLAEEGSPWAGAVQAVCATLPRLKGEEREAIRRLAAAGPPAEEVGLTPYGTPAFDPALATMSADRPVDLPMPELRRTGA
jgi:nitrate reductase molybdenum cofactor assembly chaperone NarJ/NarW